VKMQQIRAYLDRTPMGKAAREINAVKSRRDMKVLMGAGLPGILYKLAVSRELELE